MPCDYFWACVEALAVVLDSNHPLAEANLELYIEDAMQLTPEKRNELCGQLSQIIGELSRLHARLKERDGV